MKDSSRQFTPQEKLTGVIGVGVVTIMIGYISLLFQNTAEVKEAKSVAREHTDQIYAAITKISGVTSSLRTLYRVTSDYESDNLEQYTEDLIDVSEGITSIGRFDRIRNSETDKFADLMSERGIYRFELKSLQPDGSIAPATDREYHNAIVGTYPFTPGTTRLIGVDLSYQESLENSIELSTATNDTVLSSYPAGWPQTGDALLIVPTYAGRYTPETTASRNSQGNGGYVVELSLKEFLTQSAIVSSRITLPGKILQSENATPDSRRVFQRIFPGYATRVNPAIGNSKVSIEIQSASGVSVRALLQAALWMTVWLLLAHVASLLLAKNRRQDIQRRFTEKSLEDERKIALITLEAINDSVFTLTPEGKISYVNPAAEEMVNRDSDAILGTSLTDTIPFSKEQISRRGVAEIKSKLLAGLSAELTEMELHTEKEVVQVDCTFSPFADVESSSGGVLIMRDVGTERALTQKLEHLATHDSLTGLVNRYYFEIKLEEMIAGARLKGETHAICYIDLDQFKTINDTCGHAAGDKLIKQIADHLQQHTRSEDTLARLGGDEFGLLINNCGETECELIAQRVYESFQSFYFISGEHKFAVRACFGFVAINNSYDNMADVLAAADIACYSAKDRGRNELHIFKSECEETTQRHGEMLMLPKLQNALSVDKFVLFVQPIGELLENGINSTRKYEILLRMIDDDGSLMTPFQLICAAERYDLMKQVDRWVINRAFVEVASLQEIYGTELPMFSINLSGQSVMDSDLIEYIVSKIAETGVPPKNLCFEITETSAMGDTNRAITLLEFLHSQGCKLALDDFGAGECSFGYLKKLPVDYLKVDGQFVKDVDTCEVHKEMLRFVQRVAVLLDMKTVAEFVENESIVTTLREMNIDYVQGYHIGKPFNISELKQLESTKNAA